ncbi:MAG TPA: glycosyltransferase family 4 protein [Prosthecobacter sp.]|nr:glycosyltransferase family 4 protein [Prosthecobacter sp.]HRK14164.1 glycosyltransferase family 4 protein [Prosthecobacter sp.]
MNDAFDRWAARRFAQNPARILVGTETCAWHSFEAAEEIGAVKVLDCPQLHPGLLTEVMREAGDRARLPAAVERDDPAMTTRKQREYELADWRMVYSSMHRRSFERAGFPTGQQVEIPLWVDPSLWFPEKEHREPDGRLKVLFAGSITLRKGIPFLLEAFALGGGSWELTLVGRVDEALKERFASYQDRVRLLPPQTKAELRRLYAEHDLFVLPSVADSFGFVALEAMACGTPVLISENCGAPAPDAGWRVRPMDAEDLASKIAAYVENPERVMVEGRRGQEFAAQFTPERYRREAGRFFRRLLEGGGA